MKKSHSTQNLIELTKVGKRREQQRVWYQKNKDKIREKRGEWWKEWYQRNKEKIKVKGVSEEKKAYQRSYYAEHRDEIRVKRQSYYAAYTEKNRGREKARRRSRAAVPTDVYNKRIKEQRGLCAVCSVKMVEGNFQTRPCGDHCHKTKKPRGILCHKCNAGLGHFNDSPDLLRQAIKYLKKYS